MHQLTIPARPTDHSFVKLLREQAPAHAFDGPVFVEIEFRSAGQADRAPVDSAWLDTALKVLFPACLGSLWHEDGQVVDFTARAAWGERDEVVLKVYRVSSRVAARARREENKLRARSGLPPLAA